MKPTFPRNHVRGSALITVVVFTTVALLLVASLISWSTTERKLNYRNALRLEARNAAEALAEYGFSQIRQKLETRSTVNLNPSGADALALPVSSFWTGSNVDTSSIELIGGTLVQVPATGDYYYNPGDPNNESDPLKGKYVFRRDVQVISKATVQSNTIFGGPITTYVSERISVRGAPLFAHAIFYNMDLEIFPGPNMTISGPVHTNGNLYLYPGDGSTLTFTDQVTTTGRVYHAAKPGDLSDGTTAATRVGDIQIANTQSGTSSLKDSNVWKDSTQGAGTSASDWSGFRDYSSQRWHGNLQTAAHGVDNYTPVAISKYVEDTSPGVGTDDSVNTGRTIIEPSNYPTASDPDYSKKTEVESQKYANNAGIYLSVNPATGAITVSSRNKEDPSKNKALTLPATNTIVTYKPYKAVSTYSTTSTSTTYSVGAKITSGANKNKYPVTATAASTTTPYTTTITSGGSSSAAGTSTSSSSSSTTYSTSSTAPAATSGSTSTTPTTPTLAADNQGMYDHHRQKGTDLIEIDMNGLRKAVAALAGQSSTTVAKADGTGTTTAAVAATDAIGGLTASDWTGIVYVEVQGGPTTDPITGATNSATVPNSLQASVRIINGTGTVPSFGTANEGLTIATNAPVYIKGNYNADGSVSASSPTTPDTGEVPAAIVGDAVTILSQNFNDATSLSTANPTATTTNIEVSAALLVGLTPTNKYGTGTTSGGAHNLPRFLENWSGKNTYIRGSLVSLFESRVFTEPHSSSGYYSPPNRYWGFNSMFREGRYPPGTPRVMSYRRVDFTDLTAAEYQTLKASFHW